MICLQNLSYAVFRSRHARRGGGRTPAKGQGSEESKGRRAEATDRAVGLVGVLFENARGCNTQARRANVLRGRHVVYRHAKDAEWIPDVGRLPIRRLHVRP